MKYKLLAIDLDGTLLSEDKTMSSRNQHWLRRAVDAGLVVALATGRGMPKVQSYLDELGLDLPLVLANGAEVWANSQQLLARQLLSEEVVRALHGLAEEHGAHYWGYSVDRLVRRRDWIHSLFAEEWIKFGLRHDDRRLIAQLREIVRSWETAEVTYAAPNTLEVTARGVTKASGIARLCQHFGFTMGDVASIGDSHNDLHLMQSTGLAVAMGNAEELIKNVSDVVTLSENDHGVAHAISHFILESAGKDQNGP